MLSEFLVTVLTKTGHAPDGCGMSTRPSYYSGRGAITCDLDDSKLEKIHTAILQNKGEKAAKAFVSMVEAMKNLNATDFLTYLHLLDAKNYKWNSVDSRTMPHGGMVTLALIASRVPSLCLAISIMTQTKDQTENIRHDFLVRHGRRKGKKWASSSVNVGQN